VNAHFTTLLAVHIERERAWLPHDRRGRWVVLESGVGRYLTGSPRHVRKIADSATTRRARRFSSLSQARAFAHSVGGHVHRWKRTTPGGHTWQRVTPWEWARARAGIGSWLLVASVAV
jgi:hypothetical protein